MRHPLFSCPATLLLASPLVVLLGCSSDPVTPPPELPPDISYPPFGGTSSAVGKGSFRFGASSAATQIEDQNTTTDWYLWTAPKPGGLGNGTFVGDAAKGFAMSIEDVDMLAAMHLDSYRLSIEWARVEPKQGMIDQAALDHYSKLIDALIAKKIKPMITIHHFSNPVWVDDPRDLLCANGPTADNLCGWNHTTGNLMVIDAIAKHAKLLAERFGDRVDDWCTLNEPVNYLLASYGAGVSPPGKVGLVDIPGRFIPAVRSYMAAHAAMYDEIKAADTIDADGDGVAASVGFTKEAQEWLPARGGAISSDPADVAAKDRLMWVYQHMFVEAFRQGGLDSDLDGTIDEDHAAWKGKLDWLGVQYYFRAGVTAEPARVPTLNLTPCISGYDEGACIPPLDPTYVVPAMKYEHDPAGLYMVLKDFGQRWPDLPLTVTESGIATRAGVRRAEVLVRALEQIDKARTEGVDVRGYYHWSLYDNFEWSLGFEPRFGLYTVDYNTYARTPTEGATVFGQIAEGRKLTGELRNKHGGGGPLTAEK